MCSTLPCIESGTPTMRDLNRYVTKKYAADWFDIGVELGLEDSTLRTIEADYHQSIKCLQNVLNMWLTLSTSGNATWKMLEVALTNVKRQQLSLDPVNDVYGEHFVSYNMIVLSVCILSIM